ncbi:MAG: hypothetical protein LW716_09800 [Microcystis sp. 53602_E8]|nr:hypothetical protein [Microcystis sp. 53602_E8]
MTPSKSLKPYTPHPTPHTLHPAPTEKLFAANPSYYSLSRVATRWRKRRLLDWEDRE